MREFEKRSNFGLRHIKKAIIGGRAANARFPMLLPFCYC